MTVARPLRRRPGALVVRAVVLLGGAALAAWGAVTPRDAAYLAGLGLVALALLSLVTAGAARPPRVVQALAVIAALAVVVAGVWVPRSAALAAARTDESIRIGEVEVSTAGRPGLTGLADGDLLLADGSTGQRLDVDAGRATDPFVLGRGRVRVTPDGTVVTVASGRVEATSPTGDRLWSRAFDADGPAGPQPVAAADGVVVVETCGRIPADGVAATCRRRGVGVDGEEVFVAGGFGLTSTVPATDGASRGDGAPPLLPEVWVSNPSARGGDVEIRSSTDGGLVERVARGADPARVVPVVTGGTVVVSSGARGACRLLAHRGGAAAWTIDDPGCTPTSRPSGGAGEQPAVTGDRLWLPRYDDRTLTLDLRDGAGRLVPTGRRDDPGRDLGRSPDLTAWTQDAVVRLDGRTLSATDPATGQERWSRTLPRRALRWWVRGDVVAVRSATVRPLLLDPADTDEQLIVYDSRTGRVRDTLRLAEDEDDDRDSLFVPYDEGVLRLAPSNPQDVDEPWRAEVIGG